MGRLDGIDLSLGMSRGQEKERLDAAWTRLQLLRLSLGGQLGTGVGPVSYTHLTLPTIYSV